MDQEIMFRYLTKKATSEEILVFEEWLNESQSNRDLYEDWKGFWEITGKNYESFNPDTDKRWEELNALTEMKNENGKTVRMVAWRWQRIAVIALLLVSAYAMFFHSDVLTERYVSSGDTLGITLKDGSRVYLNANSEMKVRKWHGRHVELAGEAYFDVVKDPGRPFKVFTQNTVTEVLGTSFNISSSESGVLVTLVTGSVAFYHENHTDHQVVLKPGQHCLYDPVPEIFSMDTLSNLNNIAWKTGKLQFIKTPIDDLLNTLSDYYGMKFTFPQSDEFHGSFSGIIDGTSPEEAVTVIEMTLGLESSVSADSIVFSVRKKPENN